MISLRAWIDRHRAITLRRRRIMAVQDTLDLLDAGEGARNAGDLLVGICSALSDRMSKVIAELDEEADGLEEAVLAAESHELRPQLADLRHRVIAIRRYLSPQREALARLVAERAPWLDDVHRLHLREVADRMTRYVEDLDEARERALVTQEDLASRLAEQLNSKMYVLAVVAGIFLPLGLITGLLGINVGGIPGAESPYGFLVVCLLLAALAGLGVWLFRKVGIL
jgi:zinc transporter